MTRRRKVSGLKPLAVSAPVAKGAALEPRDVSSGPLETLFSHLFQAHPWHGVSPGDDAPARVATYVELVPTDTVKYELDKTTGQLRLDRPQRYSSQCPTLYGFIPQTLCGERVAHRCADVPGIRGDGDPMDVCVLSERAFSHGDFIVRVKPIGGLRMIDAGQADDKIVAVLDQDVAFGQLDDVSQLPKGLVDRLRHYFLSYKQLPDVTTRQVTIAEIYGRDEAIEVIGASMADYRAVYGDPAERLAALRRLLHD